MQLVTGLTDLPKEAVVTCGEFDGIHTGHLLLLQQLVRKATALNKPSVVILFEPPTHLKNPRLSSLREKLTLLRNLAVDYVYCFRISKSHTLPHFAEKILFGLLNCRAVLLEEEMPCLQQLKQLAESHHCEVEFFNNTSSQTNAIGQLLAEGQIEKVKPLLGRLYSLCGRVIKGNQMGRQWGIPTANLNVHQRVLPLCGVFCVTIKRQDGTCYQGVANLGNRPTIDGLQQVLEVHLFDFNDNLYGEMLEIFFLHKLRDERKFADINALIAQIHQDISEAKHYHHKLEKTRSTKSPAR